MCPTLAILEIHTTKHCRHKVDQWLYTVHLDLNFIRNKDPCQYLAISKNILYPIPWFIYDSNTHVVHGDITRDADIHHYIKFEDIV